MMNKFNVVMAGIVLGTCSPAFAASFVNVGDSTRIDFGGTQPGTSANLILTLQSVDSTKNIFTFDYVLTNTSDLAANPQSRVRGFAFDDIDVATNRGSSSSIGAAGFDKIKFHIDSYSGGLGGRDVCVFRGPGSCLGGKDGATVGNPFSGSLTLDYAGSGMSKIVLDNFAVRYQSTGLNGQGSGVGEQITSAVPEPDTWAMLLLGFFGIGGALRAAKRRQRLSLAYHPV